MLLAALGLGAMRLVSKACVPCALTWTLPYGSSHGTAPSIVIINVQVSLVGSSMMALAVGSEAAR